MFLSFDFYTIDNATKNLRDFTAELQERIDNRENR